MNNRNRYLRAAQNFANKAKNLTSVQEVVLCGSMASGDPYPEDIDLAVVLSHLDELPQLARYCRQISSTTHAWEVFVFDNGRKYLGRICHKRECPGPYPCNAKDCGKTPRLYHIWGFRFDPTQFLAPELKVLWNRNQESVLLSWRKELNLKAPRVKTYQPIRLKCWECGARFIFEPSEQKYFEKRGWEEPKRCPSCREKKWFRNMGIDPDLTWED
ncbi:zinc-ribbon domain containing protein [Effusibacillus consociatus]|uniref:Zinc-ribbon domain containing protein n=1 Tax=Effusibacillus consociatus TaxID=1117041 RepID=A0ABV9Q413_9BACL